ncbi:MucBP domain-containing protein [Companilactobacillus sp. HBUAS59699]|uniref:MucBP domain-containing protein n=1 Tax=Companilactobacillus sp. HBUAS59699 TaxID=3109358 RepID=UPI002FF13007
MNFKKRRLNKALEEKVYRVKLVHGKKGWITVGLTFVTLFSATVFGAKSVDASAVNNVATANSTTSGYVQLWNNVTKNSIRKANRGLQNGTAWKTAKAVKGVDGKTYVLVGGNEYANVNEMDLSDETSYQKLSGIVHIGDVEYARLYTDPLNGSKVIRNRALLGNSDWIVNKKVTVNGVTYYRVATNEWVKANNANLTSENSRSDKTYIKNAPDEETTTTPDTDTNNNGGSGSYNGGSTTTPAKDTANVTVKYVNTSGEEIATPKTLKNQKVGSDLTERAIDVDGYTLISEGTQNVTISKDGNTITFTYTKDVVPAETGDVTIKAVDENNNAIGEATTVTKNVGDSYIAVAPKIQGYTLDDDSSKTITVAEEGNIVTFKFKKDTTTPTNPDTDKTANVTVKYVDADGNELANPKILTDQKVGSTVTENAVEVEGFTADKDTQNVVVGADGNTITFTYTKDATDPEATKSGITVNYVAEDGTVLDSKTESVENGKPFTAEAQTIDGYTLKGEQTQTIDSVSGDKTLTFTYTKDTQPINQFDITTKYVNENGDEIATAKVEQADEGSNYTTKAIDIKGYTLKGNDTQIIHGVNGDATQTFTYTKDAEPAQKFNIVTKYVDEKGKEIAHDKTEQAEVDSVYTTSAIPVKGYTLNDDSTKSVTVDKDSSKNVIIFSYKTNETNSINVDQIQSKLFDLINSYREANLQDPLTVDDNLTLGSDVRAADEANEVNTSGDINKADHNNSDDTYFDQESHIKQDNSLFKAENLLVTYGDDVDTVAQNAFNQWKNSKDHNDNMLNSEFSKTGLSVVQLNNGEFLAIQVFAGSGKESLYDPNMDNTASIADLGYTSSDILKAAESEPIDPSSHAAPVSKLAKDPKAYFGDRVFKSLKDYKKWASTKHNEGSIWDEGSGSGTFLAYDTKGHPIGFVPYVYYLSDTASDLLAQGKTTWTTDYIISVGEPTTGTVTYALIRNDRTNYLNYNLIPEKQLTGKSGDKITISAPDITGYRLDEAYNKSNTKEIILDVDPSNNDYMFTYIANDAPLQPEG